MKVFNFLVFLWMGFFSNIFTKSIYLCSIYIIDLPNTEERKVDRKY